MSAYDRKFSVFAANLRHQCSRITSIAQICRDTKIHRQQFNKYLAGTSLPNAANLSKICSRLNLSADALFNAELPRSNDAVNKFPRVQILKTIADGNFLLNRRVNQGSEAVNELCNIKAGSYYCYFPFPGLQNFLVRSYIHVWEHENQLRFSRCTRLTKSAASSNIILRGRHDGFVFQSEDETSFVGRNRLSPNQISLININLNSKHDGYQFGLAITRAASNSIACRIALDYLGNIRPNRELLRATGLVEFSHQSVPVQMRAVLAHSEVHGNPIIAPPDRDSIIAKMARL